MAESSETPEDEIPREGCRLHQYDGLFTDPKLGLARHGARRLRAAKQLRLLFHSTTVQSPFIIQATVSCHP